MRPLINCKHFVDKPLEGGGRGKAQVSGCGEEASERAQRVRHRLRCRQVRPGLAVVPTPMPKYYGEAILYNRGFKPFATCIYVITITLIRLCSLYN